MSNQKMHLNAVVGITGAGPVLSLFVDSTRRNMGETKKLLEDKAYDKINLEPIHGAKVWENEDYKPVFSFDRAGVHIDDVRALVTQVTSGESAAKTKGFYLTSFGDNKLIKKWLGMMDDTDGQLAEACIMELNNVEYLSQRPNYIYAVYVLHGSGEIDVHAYKSDGQRSNVGINCELGLQGSSAVILQLDITKLADVVDQFKGSMPDDHLVSIGKCPAVLYLNGWVEDVAHGATNVTDSDVIETCSRIYMHNTEYFHDGVKRKQLIDATVDPDNTGEVEHTSEGTPAKDELIDEMFPVGDPDPLMVFFNEVSVALPLADYVNNMREYFDDHGESILNATFTMDSKGLMFVGMQDRMMARDEPGPFLIPHGVTSAHWESEQLAIIDCGEGDKTLSVVNGVGFELRYVGLTLCDLYHMTRHTHDLLSESEITFEAEAAIIKFNQRKER